MFEANLQYRQREDLLWDKKHLTSTSHIHYDAKTDISKTEIDGL